MIPAPDRPATMLRPAAGRGVPYMLSAVSGTLARRSNGRQSVVFRPLCRTHVALLRRWLRQPHVARWWNHRTTRAALEADFGPALDGSDPARLDVAIAGARSFGFVQRYRFADNPGYRADVAAVVDVPDTAWSIDYFVGEASMLRQGWGTAMIEAALAAIWRDEPAAPAVIVPINAANVASRRLLERAGFRAVAEGPLEPDNPVDGREHVFYRIDSPGSS
jgi:aminoglycoside 6'-N-acetyltransferase